MPRALLFVVLVACGNTSQPGADASVDQGAGLPCVGEPAFGCCAYCTDDVEQLPVCNDGSWACPSSYVSTAQCLAQNPCEIPCSLPSLTTCVDCTDGGTFAPTCDADAAAYECPAGAQLASLPNAMCTVDAGAD